MYETQPTEIYHGDERGPFALYGYYPLYDNEEVAKGVGDGTAMPHVIESVTYWMPNGIEQYHGDWPNGTQPYPPEIPSYSKYQEINFPTTSGLKPGYLHYEPANRIYYKWDGVKWDPYTHANSVDKHRWDRDEKREILYPRDPDDYILVNGVRDEWIEELP